jgi:hypothetical protein
MTSRFVPHRDRTLRSFSRAALCGVAWLLSAPLQAQEVDLVWNAPANCPQRPAVEARIRELAGPVTGKTAPLRAEGHIVQAQGRYRLTLKVIEKGERRERTMESVSCVDLAGAAAVALGLLLRPGSEGTAPSGTEGTASPPSEGTGPGGVGKVPGAAGKTGASPNESPADRPPSSDKPSTPEVRAPEAQPVPEENDASDEPLDAPDEPSVSTERRFRVILRAPVPALDVGALPKPSYGLGGAIGLEQGGFRLVAGARAFLSQNWYMAGSSDLGAEVNRWQADAVVCQGFRGGPFELSPCLSVGVDTFSARGTGPGVSPSPQRTLSLLLGAAGTAHLALMKNLSLFASVGVGIETSRAKLVIEQLGQIGQVGPVALSIGLGPEWSF